MRLMPGGGTMLSGSYDKTIRVWDTAIWACERTLQIGSCGISLLVCGDKLIAGLLDGSIVVKSTEGEWETVRTLDGHEDEVLSLAICGGKLVSGSRDARIKVWA